MWSRNGRSADFGSVRSSSRGVSCVCTRHFLARSLMSAVRFIWRQIGARADSPETWTRPIIRHPAWDAEPFDRAVNTPRLRPAFDQLVGRGRWYRRKHPGLLMIRFPSTDDPGDARKPELRVAITEAWGWLEGAEILVEPSNVRGKGEERSHLSADAISPKGARNPTGTWTSTVPARRLRSSFANHLLRIVDTSREVRQGYGLTQPETVAG